jgi:hypothetical protein
MPPGGQHSASPLLRAAQGTACSALGPRDSAAASPQARAAAAPGGPALSLLGVIMHRT